MNNRTTTKYIGTFKRPPDLKYMAVSQNDCRFIGTVTPQKEWLFDTEKEALDVLNAFVRQDKATTHSYRVESFEIQEKHPLEGETFTGNVVMERTGQGGGVMVTPEGKPMMTGGIPICSSGIKDAIGFDPKEQMDLFDKVVFRITAKVLEVR